MIVTSTRDSTLRLSFVEAAERNAPGDGGLYLPVVGRGGSGGSGGSGALEPFADIDDLLALPWRERSIEILARLLAADLPREDVAAMVAAAFDFPLELQQVSNEPGREIAALELFHGPSLSFKDFGVRFLAQILAWLRENRGDGAASRIVLTATSGDTGAAVVKAFHRLPGFGVVVLYPAGRISPLQERQIATLGENVRAFAVEGSFDDCQRMVQEAFADRELTRAAGLVAANSIHLARLLAQVTYYFEAVARVREIRPDVSLVVAVPSGNFGNLCAGLLAQRLGAPIRALVAATNANRTVPDFLDGQAFTPRASVATLSNAMDVGAPNNWQRIERLFDGDSAALRSTLRWGSADDAATLAALADLARLGYRADPHGAVAFDVLRRNLRPGEQGLFLATAHPAKFEVTRDPARALPPVLAAAAARPLRSAPLTPDAALLADRLRDLTQEIHLRR